MDIEIGALSHTLAEDEDSSCISKYTLSHTVDKENDPSLGYGSLLFVHSNQPAGSPWEIEAAEFEGKTMPISGELKEFPLSSCLTANRAFLAYLYKKKKYKKLDTDYTKKQHYI